MLDRGHYIIVLFVHEHAGVLLEIIATTEALVVGMPAEMAKETTMTLNMVMT